MGHGLLEVVLLKNKYTFLSVTLLCICIVAIYFAILQPPLADNESTSDRQPLTFKLSNGQELIVDCTLPSMPTEIPLIRCRQKADITAEKVSLIAKDLFGLTGPPVRSEYFDAYRIREGPCDLWVTDYGSIDYYVSGLEFAKDLSTMSEAKSIAEEFLERVKNYGLTPQNPQVQIVFSDVIAGYESGTADNLTVQYWDVLFAVKFNGISIAEAKVSVGDNGRIVGVQGFWREAEQVGSINIITPREAIEKIAADGYAKRISNAREIRITQISLEYWDDKTVLEQQDYLKPVYMFKCMLTSDEGKTSTAYLRITATA